MFLDSLPTDEGRHHLSADDIVDIDDEPDVVVVGRLHDDHERVRVVREQVPPMLTSYRVVHVLHPHKRVKIDAPKESLTRQS